MNSQLKTTAIEAHSRISIKIKDNFYTFEFIERRELQGAKTKVDMDIERELLWETVHEQVDKQVRDVVEIIKN